jgi:hypothetical protein
VEIILETADANLEQEIKRSGEHFLDVQVRMVQPLEAGFKNDRVEIHEKPSRTIGQLQICDDLRLMNGVKSIHCFNFNDDPAFYEQIQLQLALDELAFVFHWNMPLSFNVELAPPQLNRQAFLIEGLKQARAKNAVYFDCRSNDSVRQFI